MVGLTIFALRHRAPAERGAFVREILKDSGARYVPLAPSLGLMLERVYFRKVRTGRSLSSTPRTSWAHIAPPPFSPPVYLVSEISAIAAGEQDARGAHRAARLRDRGPSNARLQARARLPRHRREVCPSLVFPPF
jgi:hypothetical protein